MSDHDFTHGSGGDDGSDAGSRDRQRYRFGWEHALRDIREHSILSWAKRVENAYAQLMEAPSLKERNDILKQAINAALHADGRFIGKWSTEMAIEMARLSDYEIARKLAHGSHFA